MCNNRKIVLYLNKNKMINKRTSELTEIQKMESAMELYKEFIE